MHVTRLLVLFFIPTKYYQITSNSMGVMPCIRFQIQGRLYNEDSESCLSCMGHAYWYSFTFLPNIIKVCLRVSKLWPAQDFRFTERDNSNFIPCVVISTAQGIKLELSLLHPTHLLVFLFIPTKYYQIISNTMGVMACTRFRLQGR